MTPETTTLDEIDLTQQINCDLTNDLNSFRNAISDNNIDVLANYFQLPISDENFWHLVHLSTYAEEAEYDSNQDFKMSDLKKYKNEIFPKGFKELLDEIQPKQLIEKGKFTTSTKSSKNDNGEELEAYYMTATYSESENYFRCSLYLNFYESQEVYETTIIYHFTYFECQLKLKNIYLAG